MGPDRDLRGNGHKVLSIFPRQVRDGADLTLTPEQVIRKCRDIAHMDASTNDDPALADSSQRANDQLTCGREDNCGIEHDRRRLGRAAGPMRSQGTGEILSRGVAISSESVNLTSLIDRNLRYQMSSGAETVHPDPLRITGFDERAESDESCTQQRCGFLIAVYSGNGDTKALFGRGEFR